MSTFFRNTGMMCFVIGGLLIHEAFSQKFDGKRISVTRESSTAFQENKGQVIDQFGNPRGDIRYLADVNGMKVHLKSNSFSYEMYRIDAPTRSGVDRGPAKPFDASDDSPFTIISHRVDLSFIGANPTPLITAEERQARYTNHYRRYLPQDGILNVGEWGVITYHNLYPGIDIVFNQSQNSERRLKYDLILHPGADITKFRMRIEGANSLESGKDGGIVIKTSLGDITESIPASYDVDELGARTPIRASYVLRDNEVTLDIREFDPKRTTIIDPYIKWGTYFGGSGTEFAHYLNVDGGGDIYITGRTTSSNNIASSGAWQTSFAGDWDAFLAKFSNAGTLHWATYYGGAGYDNFITIVFSGSEVVVSGTTSSTSGIVSPGAYQAVYGGGNRDVLLARFSPSGTRTWASYYGGSGEDIAFATVPDASGNIYVSGSTGSPNAMASVGAMQSTFGGGVTDAFLASFDVSGQRVWGTYMGGQGYDEGNWLICPANGQLILVGETGSNTGIATQGANQQWYGGGTSDGFLASFSTSGNRLWSTYAGGADVDRFYHVSVDQAGDLLLTGITASDDGISTIGAHQPIHGGGYDAFLMKYGSGGTKIWGSYYGGAGEDCAYGIVSNAANEILLAGYTYSPTAISTPDAIYPNYLGGGDTFLARFSSGGVRIWATYLGGPEMDIGRYLYAGPDGEYYILGWTTSTTGISTPGTHQPVYDSNIDAFLIAIDVNSNLPLTLYPSPDMIICQGSSTTISVNAIGGAKPYSYQWTPTTGLATPTSRTTIASPAVTTTYTVVVTDSLMQTASAQVAVSISPPLFAHAGRDTVIRAGETAHLGDPASGGTPPYTYKWTPSTALSADTVASPDASPVATIRYIVKATDAAGCIAYDTVYVSVIPVVPPFTLVLGPDQKICPESFTTLVGTISGGTPPYTFLWSPPDGLSSTTSLVTVASPSVTTTYTLVATDSMLRRVIDTITVVVVPRPIANAGPDKTIIAGGSTPIGFPATGGTPPYSYVWTPATGLNNAFIAQPIASPTITTLYTVTVTDANGCPSIDHVLVIVSAPDQPFTVSLDPDKSICIGSSTQLFAFVSGGDPPYSYAWSPATGLSATNIANPYASPTVTTTYICTATDAFNHVARDSITVTVGTNSTPKLTITRVVPSWPNIDSWIRITCCEGTAYRSFTKNNLQVLENGVAVDSFTLHCPNPAAYADISTALVFDCPSASNGVMLSSAILAGLGFVNTMNGLKDEACVVRVENVVMLAQGMTSNISLMSSAIRGLSTGGVNTVWDACYRGVQELALNSRNVNKALILLTDGQDGASVRSIPQIIDLAARNGIRIFTIGVGDAIDSTGLQTIATRTGGDYTTVLTGQLLPNQYFRILQILRSAGEECRVSYVAACPDSTVRDVTIIASNICNGSDSKTRQYLAPRDSSLFSPVRLRLDNVAGIPHTTVDVPLIIDDVPSSDFHPSSFRVGFPTLPMTLISIQTTGYLLEGVPYTMTPVTGGVVVAFTQPKVIASTGVLALLRFQLGAIARDTVFQLDLDSWKFSGGCIRPDPSAGSLRIVIVPVPTITLTGATIFCEGDSVVLSASAGYQLYRWTPGGDTTQSITVRQSGSYTVTGFFAGGTSYTSLPVVVTMVPNPTPQITASRSTMLCAGDSVVLDAGTNYTHYHWSTGDTTRTITVTKAGTYFVDVENAIGCTGISQPVIVTVNPAPVVTLTGGTICDGDSLTLDAGDGFARYEWSTGETGRTIQVRTAGTYSVRVTDKNGCTGQSAPVTVTVLPRPATPSITRQGDVLMASKGLRYQWYKDGVAMPGETNQFLVMKVNGRYTVEVFTDESGCGAMAADIDVVLGIDATTASATKLEIYPDPHDGIFTVRIATQTGGMVRLRVVDVLGRCVLDRSTQALQSDFSATIDISPNPPGMYWVHAAFDGGQIIRKVVRR